MDLADKVYSEVCNFNNLGGVFGLSQHYASTYYKLFKISECTKDQISISQKNNYCQCKNLPIMTIIYQTLWHTGEDINILKQDLQTDIDKVNEWSNKWRMKVSVEKQNIVFSVKVVPIKKKLENWKTESNPETYISPIGKMILQADDMKKETSIEVNNIEQQYECRGMCAIRRAPEYWTTLGSSKTRTSEQAIEGQRLFRRTSPNTTVAFTDGSCMGNPGPCGAGAIIYNNEEEETIQYPVSNRGSILLAELVAIKLVLEKIDNYNYRNVKQLNLYSDSQSAIGIITLNWKSENYHKTIQEIKNRKKKLEQKGFIINIIWTPGHSDIEGNEQADRLAKAAAKEADNREEMSSITTKQDIKQAARTSVIKKWKTQWESSETCRRQQMYFGEIESVEHFLLSCDNYSLDREKLRQSIYFKTGTLNLDLEELLNTEASADIQYAVSSL
ncbi:RNASEH1 [Mytilus edulis]|uniref:RnhA n=1 Tax=Mytilus edulis TaxID=6550 RepID=A0A8S3RJY5_MYTED|nr:RNASEH1 [Mytilus edulis]